MAVLAQLLDGGQKQAETRFVAMLDQVPIELRDAAFGYVSKKGAEIMQGRLERNIRIGQHMRVTEARRAEELAAAAV